MVHRSEKLLAVGCCALTLLLVTTVSACSDRVILEDGVQAPEPPRQWAIDAAPFPLRDFLIAPRAGYDITAKVLSKRRYRWDDLAAVAPWDFALGWGPLSDEAVLRPIKVGQGDRFMFWHLYDARIDINTVNISSANVHIIPANDGILHEISKIPEGAIVRFEGELVDLHFADKRVIPSSLTRGDTGPGACEILRVQSVTVERPDPEKSMTATL
ncbi:hypothetical protein [Congregibacter litoralis]|uniref:Uncharacterized protein n=1 Tax=Congregibacter litoralis KT71 TaxID=314285 RepID=A4A7A3_9GAMM|nr:hypothetical protein [Congregibacter litoralis]EAQ98172.1 hypothetical protein KT71_02957 [Congregibacter litoralis KT71]